MTPAIASALIIDGIEYTRRAVCARDLLPGDMVEAPAVGTYTVQDVVTADGLTALSLDADALRHVVLDAAEPVTILEPIPADQPEPAWVATINLESEWFL